MSTWKFILVLTLLCPSLIYARLMDKQFNVSKNGDSTFVLIGNDYGTNVGVIVSSKGLLLIDPMPGEQSFETLHLLIKGISNQYCRKTLIEGQKRLTHRKSNVLISQPRRCLLRNARSQ